VLQNWCVCVCNKNSLVIGLLLVMSFPCYSGQVLRHLLHEAVAPTRLSRQETDEFMAYAEIGGSRSRVDYEALIDKLMF